MENGSHQHYERHAEDYRTALLGHDTGLARARFLAALMVPAPARILDLGCGPGRDLRAFAEAGHEGSGIEGAPTLAAAARTHSGCPVECGDILDHPLGRERWHGIFAQAVMFNVANADLPGLLARVRDALMPGGVLYCCDPTGSGQEAWLDGRWISLRRPQSFKKKAREAGLDPIVEWRRPEDAPRRNQDWLATLWRRPVP